MVHKFLCNFVDCRGRFVEDHNLRALKLHWTGVPLAKNLGLAEGTSFLQLHTQTHHSSHANSSLLNPAACILRRCMTSSVQREWKCRSTNSSKASKKFIHTSKSHEFIVNMRDVADKLKGSSFKDKHLWRL